MRVLLVALVVRHPLGATLDVSANRPANRPERKEEERSYKESEDKVKSHSAVTPFFSEHLKTAPFSMTQSRQWAMAQAPGHVTAP